MTTVVLIDLLARYPILAILSGYIATVDLYNLGRICKEAQVYIKPGSSIFKRLSRECLCDGHGVEARKEFRGPLYTAPSTLWWQLNKSIGTIYKEEKVEIHLYSLRCDQSDVLPCHKCGINICEQCRALDRLA